MRCSAASSCGRSWCFGSSGHGLGGESAAAIIEAWKINRWLQHPDHRPGRQKHVWPRGQRGIRGFGFSGDIEYQYVHGKLLNQNFTGGLYENGTAGLNKFTVNGGYMVFRNQWEAVATFSVLDASNFASTWTSTTLGVNWFVRHYDIRFSANYTYHDNVSGATGAYAHVGRIQAQFAW